MPRKIDYSAFFQCPEPKAAYITAKHGLPYEELRQVFIYIVAHWNRIQIQLNVHEPWKNTREEVTAKLIESIRKNESLPEDLPVFLSFDDANIASIVYDVMDF